MWRGVQLCHGELRMVRRRGGAWKTQSTVLAKAYDGPVDVLLTPAQTARQLGVSVSTVYTYIRTGQLRVRRPDGWHYKLRSRDVESLQRRLFR
jgi:excisionase family DNA binding protein